MNTRKTEENRKQKLLKQIEQQRQALGPERSPHNFPKA